MFKRLLVLVSSVLFAVSCCRSDAVRTIDTDQVERLADATAALVHRSDETHVAVYCSAVWIGDNLMATAAHCARYGSYSEAEMEDDEAFDVKANVLGRELMYLNYHAFDHGHGIDYFSDGFNARIVAIDNVRDVALLRALDPTPHSVAPLAGHPPYIGEVVHAMGHTAGLLYSYSPAVVGAVRDMVADDIHAVVIQTVSGASRGNSGSALFSASGEVYGICSYLRNGTSLVFYVDQRHVRQLLSSL